MSDICFICSYGGHLDQIKRVFKELKDYECFFITYKNERLGKTIENRKTYFVPFTGRNPILFFVMSLQQVFILLKEKPKVIISTGASICIPAFLIGKLLGIKTIYIETFARIKNPSMTGKIINKLKPNLFFVQWKHLKNQLKNSVYGGSLY